MRKTVLGIGRIFLWEICKLSVNTAYKCGWLIGFFRGSYGLFPKESTPEEIEARELYYKQLERLEKIINAEVKSTK